MSFSPAPYSQIGKPLLPDASGDGPKNQESFCSDVTCENHMKPMKKEGACALRSRVSSYVDRATVSQSALAWGSHCQNGFCFAPLQR